MLSRADALDEIDNMLANLSHAKSDLDELFDASRKISDDAAITSHDASAAIGYLTKLSEMIEADEIAVDVDSTRALVRILDSNRDIVSNLGMYRDVLEGIEKASKDMIRSTSAHEDIINQSQLLMR